MDTTLVECVVARSAFALGNEDAWVSLRVTKVSGIDHVVVVHYKHKEYGSEAFARAVKHSKTLAESLSVPFVSKRAAGVEAKNLDGASKRSTISFARSASTRAIQANEQSRKLW